MKLANSWQSTTRALIGDPEFTPVEVAEQAGVSLDKARQLWRALGFPPVPDGDRAFTRSDVATLRAVRSLLEEGSIEPRVLLQLTRVTGQSLARVAEAQVAATADGLASARPADAAPADLLGNAIESLAPSIEPFLGYVWRRHLLAAVFRSAATSGTQSMTGRAVTVGFADLVGFTAISQQLDARELAEMVDRFEALAYEHIPERGGRVVKMIGDEVMFAVDDASVAAETALALVDAYAGEDAMPDVRVGLASGSVLSWEGDLFGPTVNLASRLVNIARPGTVLVSEELGSQLQTLSAVALRHLRPVRLKGIGAVRAWVVRHASQPDAETGRAQRSRRR